MSLFKILNITTKLAFLIIALFNVAKVHCSEELKRETTCFLSFPSSKIAVIEREQPPKGETSLMIQFDDYLDTEDIDGELEMLRNTSFMLDLSCRQDLTLERLRLVTQISLVTALALAETNLGNAELKMISSMPLKYLNISDNRFDDEGMPFIGLMSQLIELKIGYNQVTKKGILSLSALKNLKILDAHGTFLKNGIQNLTCACNQLEVLNVRVCGIKDTDLDYFLTMPYLKVLHILGNKDLTSTVVDMFVSQKREDLYVIYDR